MPLIMRDPEEITDEVKKAFKVLDRHKQGYIMIANIRELNNIFQDSIIKSHYKLKIIHQ
jgi:Ca2+-binding EF-hand superfamily protein